MYLQCRRFASPREKIAVTGSVWKASCNLICELDKYFGLIGLIRLISSTIRTHPNSKFSLLCMITKLRQSNVECRQENILIWNIHLKNLGRWQGVKPQTFRFYAPMLYYWGTENFMLLYSFNSQIKIVLLSRITSLGLTWGFLTDS